MISVVIQSVIWLIFAAAMSFLVWCAREEWKERAALVPYGKVYFKYGDCPVHLDPNAEQDGL